MSNIRYLFRSAKPEGGSPGRGALFALALCAALAACSGTPSATPDADPTSDAGPRCGNQLVEPGEQCDDGHASDRCDSKCRTYRIDYLKAAIAERLDSFGESIALSADASILAIGAPRESSAALGIDGDAANNDAAWAGAVYVFVRSEQGWAQASYLKASNTDPDDLFGWSVALSEDGTTLAVGAPGEDSAATGVDGDQADNTAPSGAVYLFGRSGGTWRQQAYVKASNASSGFGFAVGLSRDGATLAVGAPGEASAATGIDGNQTDTSATNSGAVYVFARSGETWRQQAYVKASNTDRDDQFGRSLAVSGDGSTVAVGAHGEQSAATGVNGDQGNAFAAAGAAYVFARAGGTWRQEAYVKASATYALDQFGMSVALSDDGAALAVGAPLASGPDVCSDDDPTNNVGCLSGGLYLFTRAGATWTQAALLQSSNAGFGFGYSAAFSRDATTLMVSAAFENSASTGIDGNQIDDTAPNAGAVYRFAREGTTWTQRAYIKASNTGAGDNFGTSIALSADGATLAVGAPAESSAGRDPRDDTAQFSGAAYIVTGNQSTAALEVEAGGER